MTQGRLHQDYIQENFLATQKKDITSCKNLAFAVYYPSTRSEFCAFIYKGEKNLQKGLSRSVTVPFFLVFYFCLYV